METSREMFLLNILNTITHFCIGSIIVVCCIFGVRFQESGSFSQHIILCVLGYILLISQSIMIFSNSNSWSQALSYEQKKPVHLTMQVVGSILAMSGIIIRIIGYEGNTFGTGHGIMGLITLIFTVLTLIGGVANIYMTNQAKFNKIGHALSGCLTLIFAAITLMIGMDKLVFRIYFGDSGANTLIAFTVITLIGVLSPALLGVYKRIIN